MEQIQSKKQKNIPYGFQRELAKKMQMNENTISLAFTGKLAKSLTYYRIRKDAFKLAEELGISSKHYKKWL